MSQNKSTIQVSPNLLANFNPFDILEPEKCDINGLKVEKLINVDDSQPNIDIDPSLLDQKPHYDLIDLYQNFYVTPQHVKLKSKGTDIYVDNPSSSSNGDDDDLNESASNGPRVGKLIEIDNFNGQSNFNDLDFKIFCDKYESGDKVCCTEDGKENIVPQDDNNDDATINKVLKDEEDEIDPEELIKEVLYEKIIEKRYMDDMNNGSDENTDDFEHKNNIPVDSFKPKVLKSPSIDILAIKNAKSMINNNRLETIHVSNSSKQDKFDIDLAKEFYLKLNNDYNNDINVYKTDNNLKINGQINNVVNFDVIPIKKDEKVFKKRRMLKPESKTCNFTKGPGIQEKNIVLPQIMKRIYDRKALLENKTYLKKVLILDDRKNETNIEHRTTNDMRKGDYIVSDMKEITKNTKNDHTERPTVSNIEKFDNRIAKDVADLVQKQCCHCSCTKSPTKEKNSSNSTKSSVRDINSSEREFGEVMPIIVMEDCRQERIKAHRTSQMFRKFVLEGCNE